MSSVIIAAKSFAVYDDVYEEYYGSIRILNPYESSPQMRGSESYPYWMTSIMDIRIIFAMKKRSSRNLFLLSHIVSKLIRQLIDSYTSHHQKCVFV